MKLGVSLSGVVVLLAALLAGCDNRRGGGWEAAGTAKGPARPLDDSEIVSDNRVSGNASALVAGPLGGVPLSALLIAAVTLAWAHRRRALAERAVETSGPLQNGPQRIAGVVEDDPGASAPPVVVYVQQSGTEVHGKGGFTHQWKEVYRDVVVRPFHLRRDDGLLIRVEPDAGVMVQAQLAVGQRHAVDSRTRQAEIRVGARVQITGELMGGKREGSAVIDPVYRDAPSSAVIVPPRSGRMVISAETPGETAGRRARFHAIWAGVLVAMLALIFGGAAHTYFVLAVDGDTLQATPTAAREWEEYVKPKNSPGRWVPHHGVRAEARVDGEAVTVEDACGVAVYRCVRAGTCPRLPFVISAHLPGLHQVGRVPTLSEGLVALLLLSTLFLAIFYPASAFGTRPWYLKSRVVDGGSGKLETS